MAVSGLVLLLAMVAALLVSTPVLGRYFARVYGDDGAPGDRVFLPAERLVYRVMRIDDDREQR